MMHKFHKRKGAVSCALTFVSTSLILTGVSVKDATASPTQVDAVQAKSVDFLPGDLLPDAPALAARGSLAVGVRTVNLVNPGQIDILHATKDNPAPLYSRPVTLEIWYPARVSANQPTTAEYTDCLSPRPGSPPPPVFTFSGRAARGAAPDSSHGPYPLIVVSHGYPGSRVMMSYLTENLASKGYVVAAIDHADSTHFDKGPFVSTLVNRWKDVTFVLDSFQSAQSSHDSDGPLDFAKGLVDVQKTALIGYSMGGYGVLNVAGAGYSSAIQSFAGGHLAERLAGSPGYHADPRVKAIVAFAPWGEAAGVWDADGLSGLHVPTLFVDGDHDDVAGYENGVKAIFQGAVNADRYLLVYENARHNIAPNPPPLLVGMDSRAFLGYGEPDWDSRRINNVNEHFVTAFLDTYLAGKDESQYLKIPVHPGTDDWAGFPARTALGLELWHLPPANSGSP